MAHHRAAQRSSSPVGGASFEALYSAHHRTVLAYCARRARRNDAWDATAEVFTVAWRRFGEMPAGNEALPWLLGVASRVIANQRRSERRRRRLTQRVASIPARLSEVPDAQLIRNEEEAAVINALHRLRERDREVILLVLWEELPREQIAVVLGISRAAVDQRLSRARRRLAHELDCPPHTPGHATPGEIAKGGAK